MEGYIASRILTDCWHGHFQWIDSINAAKLSYIKAIRSSNVSIDTNMDHITYVIITCQQVMHINFITFFLQIRDTFC